MKRALDVIDPNAEPTPARPILLKLGTRVLSVTDTGDGRAARELADALVEWGGAELDSARETEVGTRIVVRGQPRSAKARVRAEVLEEGADLILGSARPEVARRLAQWGASLRHK